MKWLKGNLWWMGLVCVVLLVTFYPREEEVKSKPNPWEEVQIVKVVVEGSDEVNWYNNWQGTGVFIADNLILTAGHIVGGANDITITTIDEKEYKAVNWYFETEADLGIIEVNTTDVELIAEFDKAIVGESVWAIGNPFGVFPVLTKGIISAIDMPDDYWGQKDMIITDCPVNGGNSGCPLLDEDGNILGICSWGYLNADGMSYFVRAEICQLVLDKYHAIRALERAD